MILENLEVEEGINTTFKWYYTDPITNLPINLTNYKASFAVRPYAELPPAILVVDSSQSGYVYGGSVVTLTPDTGEIQVYLDPKETRGLYWNQAPWDLILLNQSSNQVIKFAKGLFTILPTQGVLTPVQAILPS